jgi:hypothetical protein
VAARRWTELPRRFGEGLVRDLRGLRGNERLAVGGAALLALSLPLPWYSVEGTDLVRTGFGSFGWAAGAMLLMAATVVFLALQLGGGYVPPRPLSEGGLLIAAGAWTSLIVAYLMFDRPELSIDTPLADISRDYGLGYGLFVALAGAAVIAAAGARARFSASRPRSRRSPSPSP